MRLLLSDAGIRVTAIPTVLPPGLFGVHGTCTVAHSLAGWPGKAHGRQRGDVFTPDASRDSWPQPAVSRVAPSKVIAAATLTGRALRNEAGSLIWPLTTIYVRLLPDCPTTGSHNPPTHFRATTLPCSG
jgi:hypothetical protein